MHTGRIYHTTEWVEHLGELLNQQTINNHVNVNNPWLWDSVALAFNCQYADKLTQENVMAELQVGIKMVGAELDDYLNQFEGLVHHAGLNINEQMALDKFTQQGCWLHCTRTFTVLNQPQSPMSSGGQPPLNNKRSGYTSKDIRMLSKSVWMHSKSHHPSKAK